MKNGCLMWMEDHMVEENMFSNLLQLHRTLVICTLKHSSVSGLLRKGFWFHQHMMSGCRQEELAHLLK